MKEGGENVDDQPLFMGAIFYWSTRSLFLYSLLELYFKINHVFQFSKPTVLLSLLFLDFWEFSGASLFQETNGRQNLRNYLLPRAQRGHNCHRIYTQEYIGSYMLIYCSLITVNVGNVF